jgi:hypothetical protein
MTSLGKEDEDKEDLLYSPAALHIPTFCNLINVDRPDV